MCQVGWHRPRCPVALLPQLGGGEGHLALCPYGGPGLVILSLSHCVPQHAIRCSDISAHPSALDGGLGRFPPTEAPICSSPIGLASARHLGLAVNEVAH